MTCKKCGKPICHDEAGLPCKLINRGATEFFCFDCLGDMFQVSREKLDEMVEGFRAAGCTLFL